MNKDTVVSELNKRLLPTDNSKKSIKGFLKRMFGALTSTGGFVKADDAYVKAKYGGFTTEKHMFATLLTNISERIKNQVEQNQMYTMVPILPELMGYVKEVAGSLKQCGYQVWILDQNALNKLQPKNRVNKTTMFLLILWDRVY